MIAERRTGAITSTPPEAVCLELEPDPVLAFLHLPSAAPDRPTAVLMCPPFGWEENCSYRARRRWAQALADAGYPTARIDLPGSGDSGGSPRDPDRFTAWVAAASGAAAWLRERTGSERVTAIGIGIGGTVAYCAAARGAPIDDLILWAVPGTGRALLRELKAFAGVVAARHPADQRGGAPGPDDDAELIGHVLSAETARSLEQLRLTDLELPDAGSRRVLMLARDGLNPDKRLRAHLEAAGATVAVADCGDYEKMIARPQQAESPLETISLSIAWLGEGPATARAAAAPRRPAQGDSMEFSHDGKPIRETPIELELSEGPTFGLLCEPLAGERAPVCGVLLNGGALRHTGPNRTSVELARRWAAQGVATVRVDMQGIGDAEGDERMLVSNAALYSQRSTADALGLLEQLAAHGLPDRFVMGGLCSAAYWALHTALKDERVVGALMINLYSFYWSEALVTERQTFEALGALREQGWRRVVRRDVRPDRLMDAIRSMRPSRIRSGSRHLVEYAQREQIERDLDQLRDQGTEALLLLCHGEPLYDQLVRQRLTERLDRWPNLTLERIPSRDHMFRALWLQEHVHASLDRALERTLARVATP
jgi:alpha-beta hydrolase superfamily lysophospholipase